MSGKAPKIFIIWTFIEWVFRFLVIQLPIFFKEESKAMIEKMINLRLCEHVRQRQGCTCPCFLHHTGPQCTWWSSHAGSYSMYEGELWLHLMVETQFHPRAQEGLNKQGPRKRFTEKAEAHLRDGELAGIPRLTLLPYYFVSYYLKNVFTASQFNAISTTS